VTGILIRGDNMFNIKFKGKYTNENQLTKAQLPSKAIMFKEPNNITGVFLLGGLISLPMIVITFIGLIGKINLTVELIGVSSVISMILVYLHEFIHALSFPKNMKKEIWTKFDELALFVYCNEAVSKTRFIWVSIAPNLILGFIPFILFIMGVFDFNNFIRDLIGFTSWVMIISGIGDYLNIYNAIRQVPNKAYIINSGFHSFWFKL